MTLSQDFQKHGVANRLEQRSLLIAVNAVAALSIFFFEQQQQQQARAGGGDGWAGEFAQQPPTFSPEQFVQQQGRNGAFSPQDFFNFRQQQMSPASRQAQTPVPQQQSLYQRPPMYGSTFGGSGFGMQRPMMFQPQQPMYGQQPQEQYQGKGKGRIQELSDTDWEEQFKELSTVDKEGELDQLDADAEQAIEAELNQMDRYAEPLPFDLASCDPALTLHCGVGGQHGNKMVRDAGFGEFEDIWQGYQAEANVARDMLGDEGHMGEYDEWKDFDGMSHDFDGLRTFENRGPHSSNYLFEENNLFDEVPNAFEEGLKIMREGGSLSLAALAFEAAVQKQPEMVEAWVALGSAQAQNEKESPAIRAMEQALKLDSNNLDALMGLSVSYTNEGYDSLAYRTLERWVSVKYPQLGLTPQGLDEAVQAEEEMGFTDRHQLHEKVTALFLEAAQLNPEGMDVDIDVQVGLGVLFYGSEDYDKAVDCFNAALDSAETGTMKREGEEHLLWNRLGATLANSGRSEEAIEAYSRALELRSNFVRARYNLGVSCINLGVLEQAAGHLLGALSMHRVIEREGRMKAAELLRDGNGNAVDDREVEGLLQQNQSTNLYDTLRRVFTQMDRRDLSEGEESKSVVSKPEDYVEALRKDIVPNAETAKARWAIPNAAGGFDFADSVSPPQKSLRRLSSDILFGGGGSVVKSEEVQVMVGYGAGESDSTKSHGSFQEAASDTTRWGNTDRGETLDWTNAPVVQGEEVPAATTIDQRAGENPSPVLADESATNQDFMRPPISVANLLAAVYGGQRTASSDQAILGMESVDDLNKGDESVTTPDSGTVFGRFTPFLTPGPQSKNNEERQADQEEGTLGSDQFSRKGGVVVAADSGMREANTLKLQVHRSTSPQGRHRYTSLNTATGEETSGLMQDVFNLDTEKQLAVESDHRGRAAGKQASLSSTISMPQLATTPASSILDGKESDRAAEVSGDGVEVDNVPGLRIHLTQADEETLQIAWPKSDNTPAAQEGGMTDGSEVEENAVARAKIAERSYLEAKDMWTNLNQKLPMPVEAARRFDELDTHTKLMLEGIQVLTATIEALEGVNDDAATGEASSESIYSDRGLSIVQAHSAIDEMATKITADVAAMTAILYVCMKAIQSAMVANVGGSQAKEDKSNDMQHDLEQAQQEKASLEQETAWLRALKVFMKEYMAILEAVVQEAGEKSEQMRAIQDRLVKALFLAAKGGPLVPALQVRYKEWQTRVEEQLRNLGAMFSAMNAHVAGISEIENTQGIEEFEATFEGLKAEVSALTQTMIDEVTAINREVRTSADLSDVNDLDDVAEAEMEAKMDVGREFMEWRTATKGEFSSREHIDEDLVEWMVDCLQKSYTELKAVREKWEVDEAEMKAVLRLMETLNTDGKLTGPMLEHISRYMSSARERSHEYMGLSVEAMELSGKYQQPGGPQNPAAYVRKMRELTKGSGYVVRIMVNATLAMKQSLRVVEGTAEDSKL
ncbi:Peroxisomal membrane signal receptor PTS1 [Elasticomyces elasticus]|nr:Peroxisomal membrane signal receptor PTS1 [Elasticomyces elasticus]